MFTIKNNQASDTMQYYTHIYMYNHNKGEFYSTFIYLHKIMYTGC